MKSPLFTTIREMQEHAAYMVACFWLASASKILDRGELPVKLSKCSLTLTQDELSREIYQSQRELRRRVDHADVARLAIQLALAKLYAGQFPKVRNFFEITGEDTDSKRFCSNRLKETGEVTF